jgi:hypothetical protein
MIKRTRTIAAFMPRELSWRRMAIMSLVMLWLAGSRRITIGQDEIGIKFTVPDEKQAIDFRAANPQRRITFTQQGMAYEVPLNLFMIKHRQITITADAPEEGSFEIVSSNPKAGVKIENVRVNNGKCSAEVVVSIPPLSSGQVFEQAQARIDAIRRAAQQQATHEADTQKPEELPKFFADKKKTVPRNPQFARQDFIQFRAADLAREAGAAKLAELQQRRPQWFTAKQREAWEKKDDNGLLDEYRAISEFDIIDQHLRDAGFVVETTAANFRNLLLAKLAGIYAITSGKTLRKDPPPGTPLAVETNQERDERAQALKAVAALDPAELQHLRELLTVNLRCRFLPAADPRDPNAQWFNGQRVSCRAFGVESIRVQGRLDAAHHDRVDWWQLDGYDPQLVQLELPAIAGIVFDPPFVAADGVRLRVRTSDSGRGDYWFELRPKTALTGKAKVLIHETPAVADAKFPF